MDMQSSQDRRLIRGSTAPTTRVWTLHGDQRLVGVCYEQNAASLVASGERHVQIRSLSQTTTVGKLVPFESEQSVLRPAQGVAQRYYVSYPRRTSGPKECARLLDAAAMEFVDLGGGEDASASSSGRPADVYRVQDACVDVDGRHVALVESQQAIDEATTLWRLRCWSRTDHERRGVWTTTPARRTTGDQHAWAMRFLTTVMFGQCLMVVHLAKERAEWTLQQQLFTVSDYRWTLLREQRTCLRLSSDSSPQLQLSASCRWLAVYDRRSQQLQCVPLDLFGAQRPPVSMDVEAPVADVAWSADVLAVLLTNGRVHFRRPQSSSFVQAAHLIDASTLLDPQPASPNEWSRVLWSAADTKLLLSCGPHVVEVAVRIEVSSDSPAEIPVVRNTGTLEMSTPPHRRRRRRRTQPTASAPLSKDIDRIVASPTSEATLVELLDAIRLVINSTDLQILDVAFTLLGILLQRVLRRLGFTDTENTDDLQIQIGIMEMLVAQVVTGEAVGVHQAAETVTQAPAFRCRTSRRSYYARELQWLASTRDVGLRSDGTRSSFAPFIESTMDRVIELLSEAAVSTSSELVSVEDTSQDARRVLSAFERPNSTSASSSPWLQLQALVLSCATACEFYQVDSVVLDIDLLHAALSQPRSIREQPTIRPSFVRRFLSSRFAKLRIHATPSHDQGICLASVSLRLAHQSGSLAQLVQFCSSLDVSDPYSLLIRHQDNYHNKHKREIDPRLSRAVAMNVIDKCLVDLVSMLRHAPLLPSHGSSCETKPPGTAASIDQFVKLVFVSTDPSTDVSDSLSLLGLALPLLHLNEEEATLRTKSLRLARLVMQQLRHMISFASDSNLTVDSDAVICSALRKVFLSDSLWRESSASDVHSLREAMLFLKGVPPSQSKVYGRVAGATTASAGVNDQLSPRLLRALRSLALILWSHWIREQCSAIKATLEARTQCNEETKRLGALATWSALQLKTLALYRDENDHEELLALQLWLLDSASALDPETTSRVLQWGFSADSVNARYLRRFRVLRAAVADSNRDEDTVAPYKRQLREAVRSSSTSGGALDNDADEELDALGVSCCDSDFQRVVWALIQRRFLVVSRTETVVVSDGSTSDRSEMKRALQSRPSNVDGLISRHEVVQLLKAQRLEIEQQMQRVQKETVSTTSPVKPMPMNPPHSSSQVDETQQPATSAPRIKSYNIRDLSPPPRGDHSKERLASPTKGVLRKGSSTQNVLKLLQLRKDQQELKRHQSAPRMVPVALSPKNDPPPAEAPARAAPSQPTPMPVRKRATQPQPRPPVPPPLRRDHDEQAGHAELILLTAKPGRTARHKSVPLKRRSFRLETIPPVNGLSHLYQIPLDADDEAAAQQVTSQATQCTTLKTASVQTEVEQEEENSAAVQPATTVSSGNRQPPASKLIKTEDVGVQSQTLHSAVAQDEARPPQHAASLAARFPVYVDLPSGAAAASGNTFLHVTALPTQRVAAQRKQRERVKVGRAQSYEPHAVEAPVVPTRSPGETPVLHEEPAQAEDGAQRLQERDAQRRQTYRNHFPPTAAQLTGGSSVGMESFVSLKSEMERMKAKLMELETSAKDLDDEFKVSHETLETMGRRQATKVLEQVDDAIAESAAEDSESASARGVLSTKATRDLAGARHLLAQIEQLTAANERGNTPHN